MEFITTKVGLVILVLGMMHFFNIRSLVKFRDNKLFKALDPKRNEGQEPPKAAIPAP